MTSFETLREENQYEEPRLVESEVWYFKFYRKKIHEIIHTYQIKLWISVLKTEVIILNYTFKMWLILSEHICICCFLKQTFDLLFLSF